ncbi:MAG: hypothetical protein L3J46_05005 [Kangiellaceae bacterium]|nr:hypothetical protein [Kangiellaceae bacterium]
MVVERFGGQTLWIFQFVVLEAWISTLTVIGRMVVVRKDDLEARYQLDKSHQKIKRLQLVDPLTECWNRRFME